jgi:hypothetical protein
VKEQGWRMNRRILTTQVGIVKTKMNCLMIYRSAFATNIAGFEVLTTEGIGFNAIHSSPNTMKEFFLQTLAGIASLRKQ